MSKTSKEDTTAALVLVLAVVAFFGTQLFLDATQVCTSTKYAAVGNTQVSKTDCRQTWQWWD